MRTSPIAAVLLSIALSTLLGPAQAASMVEFAKKMDEVHKYQEFKRADPEHAAILVAPKRSGSMVEFAKKSDALNKYQDFKKWCHYKKHNGQNAGYTCDHPTW